MAKTDFKMSDYNLNKNLVSALGTRTHQAELVEDSIDIMYGFLDQTFKVLDEEDILVKQIIPCLATLSKKTANDIVNNVIKPYNF